MNLPLPEFDDDEDQNNHYLYNENNSHSSISNTHDVNNIINNIYPFQSIKHLENNYLPEIPLQYSNQSFPYIYPETVLQLMKNEIKLKNFPQGVKLVFIDCRFAYEYNAGHINSAYNLLTFDDLISIFNSERDDNVIVIFHCELTIDRSVKWAYIFRNYDRYFSGLQFPQLAYPNLYLLKGGFRDFYNFVLSSTSDENLSLSNGPSFDSCPIPMENPFQFQDVQIENNLANSNIISGEYLTKDDGFSVYGSSIVKESQALFTSQIKKATNFLNTKGISKYSSSKISNFSYS